MSKLVVLDPTELYDIPVEYMAITNEVEWLRYFFIAEGTYWVKGKQLCDWTEEWLRGWNKTEAIIERKYSPKEKLKSLCYPLPIPNKLTEKQIFSLLNQLDSYQEDKIAYFLAEITNKQPQFWLEEPSLPHLALWLTLIVLSEYQFLEQVWVHQRPEHPLNAYYQTENKLQLLRQWLGIREPLLIELGKYPLPIPDMLKEEFDQYWQQKIYSSEGKIIDQLIPTTQSGMEEIAQISYQFLNKHPQWITKEKEVKLSGYLASQQKKELTKQKAPPEPLPLTLEKTTEEVLTWVTEKYLPFRCWEIENKQSTSKQKISDFLAESFVNWIVEHYSQLKLIPVDDSPLNYNVAHLVQNLCQDHPVFWVVVDGLGWLDHLELISYLTENHGLAVENGIQPRLSILPTLTKYAKWSLYSQLLPNSSQWKDDISQGFSLLQIGKRYTDKQVNKLYKDLKQKKHSLYCWDTTKFDALQHNQQDWHSFYNLERTKSLKGIAEDICYCVKQYPEPEKLKILIASDHGQLLGISTKIANCPAELKPEGRTALGTTNDERFIVLNSDRYGIPETLSIIRGSESFGSFSYTESREIIGSHGGLFPEEVIVGVSILCQSVKRIPVVVYCQGEGKAKEKGELKITIHNPNSIPITDLCLYIDQLYMFKNGQPLTTIKANDKITLNIIIPEFPEFPINHSGNKLKISLSGNLDFCYSQSEYDSVKLDEDSYIIIKRIFSSGFNIDEFF